MNRSTYFKITEAISSARNKEQMIKVAAAINKVSEQDPKRQELVDMWSQKWTQMSLK